MQINSLTSAEESLMKLLWQLNSFYLKDVMEQHAEPKPHQNTVSTYLKILVEKNFLATKKEGRIFKYSVKVPYNDYKNFVIQNIINDHFNGDSKELLSFLSAEKIVATPATRTATKKPVTELFPEVKEPNPIAELVEELTSPKKANKKAKEKDKDKDKKKKKKKK